MWLPRSDAALSCPTFEALYTMREQTGMFAHSDNSSPLHPFLFTTRFLLSPMLFSRHFCHVHSGVLGPMITLFERRSHQMVFSTDARVRANRDCMVPCCHPVDIAGYFLQHQELLDVPAVDGRGCAVYRRSRDIPGLQVPDQRNAGAGSNFFYLVSFCFTRVDF